MAGDLDAAYVAHCFEVNASRFQSTFDEILRKYDRDFPDDDIIELHRARIVHDRGIVKSMPTKRVGGAGFGKLGHGKADAHAYPSHSQLDQRNSTSSPEASEKSFLSMSEKSFISVNCSRWVNNIEEESEPSDAETLTDSEDDGDSWEDETEEAVLSRSERAEITAEEDGSLSARGSEEEDEWLTIAETGHWKRRNTYLSDRKAKHAHPHTGPHTATHKALKQNDLASYKRRKVYQLVPRHSRKKGEVSRVSPQSGLTTEQNVSHRIGPPRRVRLVTLFSQLQDGQETSEVFSKEPGSFEDVDSYSDERSVVKKVFSDAGGHRDPQQARAGLLPSSRSFFTSGCEDVDFFLPSGSVTNPAHVDDTPVEDGLPPLQKNASYRGTDTGWSKNETCQAKPLSAPSPPLSRLSLENTYIISKSTPSKEMMTKYNGRQIPDGRAVRTFSLEDDLRGNHPKLRMDQQEVVEGDCKILGTEKIPGTETSLTVAVERTLPGASTHTDSYSSQSGRREDKAVTCPSSSLSSCDCTVVEGTGIPRASPQQDTSPLLSSGPGKTRTDQEVDLKQRAISLVEIRKKLDRLSALLIPESFSTPDKSTHFKEDAGVLGSIALPEKMEISPEPELRNTSHHQVTVVSSPGVAVTRSEDCRPRGMTRMSVSPGADVPANQTFIMADKADCKHVRSNNHPSSPHGLTPAVDSTSGVEVFQVPSTHKEQESKSKRKFRPAYKPISSEEIQDVLEMYDPESVISFLKEKSFKEESNLTEEIKQCPVTPSTLSQKDSWKGFNPDTSRLSSVTKSADVQTPCASYQLPCKQEMSICVECCQVPQESIKMERTGQKGTTGLPGRCSPVEKCPPELGVRTNCCACLDSKMSGRSPQVAESRQQNKQSQTAQCLFQDASREGRHFLATPGQIFRQTIESLHPPSTTAQTDGTVQDHVRGKENQSSRENLGKQPFSKSDLKSVLKRQAAKSAALFTELESECVCPALSVPSPGAGERQTQPYGSADHTLFLQIKQSTDSRTTHKPPCTFSSADEQKVCCHKTPSSYGCQRTTTGSTPVRETIVLNRVDSTTTPDKRYQGCSIVSASGDGPLSLLNRMDSKKPVPSEKLWPEINSASGHNTDRFRPKGTSEIASCHVGGTQHKEKSSGSSLTAQQKQKEHCDKKMFGRAYASSPSPLSRRSYSSSAAVPPMLVEHPAGITPSPCYGTDYTTGRTLDQRDEYRMQKAVDNSDDSMRNVTCDSLSVTPQSQSMDPNQSTTPSKLMDRLQLSEGRSPLNLTKNCNKLSRLMLDSPGQRKGKCTTETLPKDRQLELRKDSDIGQQKGSLDATAGPNSQRENRSSKIFKSKNSWSVPQMASRQAASLSSKNRCSSPQKTVDTTCAPRVQGPAERRMVHISSPKAGKLGSGSHPFSFTSDPSNSTRSTRLPSSFISDSCNPAGSCKRSFQSDLDGTDYARHKEMNSTSSPLKRRRLNAIHGTSTPSKLDGGAARFDLDVSLSTIAGENSDLNSTLNSSDMGTLDDPNSGSEEEDEITLIPE